MTAAKDREGAGGAARWCYRGLWRVLVEWFRVPSHAPTLPVEPGGAVESFQPAAGFLSYMKLWFWIVAVLIDIVILVGWLAIVINEPLVGLITLPLALLVGIVPDIIAYIAVHLRFDTTWYVMTERSLRIRRGIWVIHEMTITFENVQNVRVQQGPVQRLFGIADLVVETAGGGGDQSSGVGNRAIIEGVADAPRIRETILARLRGSRTAGLGDEIDRGSGATRFTRRHIDLLREIREAVAAI